MVSAQRYRTRDGPVLESCPRRLLRRGHLDGVGTSGAQNPAGYDVMLGFFFLLGLTALLPALLLWRREAGPNGHQLEAARSW